MTGSIQDTRVYRSAVTDIKNKDHDLVVSRINVKLKYQKGDYLPGSYYVGRIQGENLRETFQEHV